jgi:chaperone required for assembly of F1-ATPase
MIASEWNSIAYRNTSSSSSSSSSSSLYPMAIDTDHDDEHKIMMYSEYIIPSQMPFMSMACTTLDQTYHHMELYQNHCLQYFHTDTICYYTDPIEDRVLYQKQQHHWDPIHTWFTSTVGRQSNPTSSSSSPSIAVGSMEGVMFAKHGKGLCHPPQLVQACETWIQSLDAWHLTALYNMCADTKRFMISSALLMAVRISRIVSKGYESSSKGTNDIINRGLRFYVY